LKKKVQLIMWFAEFEKKSICLEGVHG